MEERIIFIDGAMGTSIQKYKLQEEDFRGGRVGVSRFVMIPLSTQFSPPNTQQTKVIATRHTMQSSRATTICWSSHALT